MRFNEINEAKKPIKVMSEQDIEVREWFKKRFRINNKLLSDKNVIVNDGSVTLVGSEKSTIDVQSGYGMSIDIPYKIDAILGAGIFCHKYTLGSLKNFPDKIDGSLIVSNNIIHSFEGGPSYIGGDCFASYCGLTSLKGAASFVGEHFDCSHNKITSLEFGPRAVGEYNASHNPLESLVGLPEETKEIAFDYHPNLELLKLLSIKKLNSVRIYYHSNEVGDFHPLSRIVHNVVSNSSLNYQQKVFLLKRELIKNGYESNARL